MYVLPAKFVNSHNELDNILVRQKDEIIRMIDRGDIDNALGALRVLWPLWNRLDYAYKYIELQNRAHHAIAAAALAAETIEN